MCMASAEVRAQLLPGGACDWGNAAAAVRSASPSTATAAALQAVTNYLAKFKRQAAKSKGKGKGGPVVAAAMQPDAAAAAAAAERAMAELLAVSLQCKIE